MVAPRFPITRPAKSPHGSTFDSTFGGGPASAACAPWPVPLACSPGVLLELVCVGRDAIVMKLRRGKAWRGLDVAQEVCGDSQRLREQA